MVKKRWLVLLECIGEELVCSREPTNEVDRYTAAMVMKEETFMGHLARRIS